MNHPEPYHLEEDIESLAEQANSLIHATGSLSAEDVVSFRQSIREHSSGAARAEDSLSVQGQRRFDRKLVWAVGLGVLAGFLLARATCGSSGDTRND